MHWRAAKPWHSACRQSLPLSEGFLPATNLHDKVMKWIRKPPLVPCLDVGSVLVLLVSDTFLNPLENDSGDFIAILFDKHEVTIPLDADVLQLKPGMIYLRLSEELRSAGIPPTVVSGGTCQEED